MANSGNSWNSFMQTRQARIVLYSLCVFFSVFYGVDALMEILHPENAQMLIEQVGATGYYAMTGIRMVVCLVTAVMFGRIVLKTIREDDE